MKHLIAMIAIALFAATPLVAQDGEVIELPSGEKVRIVEKDGVRIIKPVDKKTETTEEAEARKTEAVKKDLKKVAEIEEEVEIEDDFEADLPDKIREILKRARKEMDRVEKDLPAAPEGDIRKEVDKRMEEMRRRMEELRKEFERDFERDVERDGNVEKEVEEYESEDGSVKIKIVRIRKTSGSSDKSEESKPTPRKEESPRKQ